MPERGEIVVFKLPSNDREDYIKRVIGLPGDRIQVTAGVLYINGQAVPRVEEGTYEFEYMPGQFRTVPQFRETLPNGVSYLTVDAFTNGAADFTDEYVVPDGHFFMMGDNRDNSLDSRFLSQVGYVPYDNLVGRAELRFFSTDGSAALWEVWRWPAAIRWGRLVGFP
jgi:signal peptidase I